MILGEKPFEYPKDISESCLGYQWDFFFSDLGARAYTELHLIFDNVSDFWIQCFGYTISDIRKDFRICYDASPW